MCVFVCGEGVLHARKGMRLSNALLEEGCVTSPNQVESLVTKLSPMLTCFISEEKNSLDFILCISSGYLFMAFITK